MIRKINKSDREQLNNITYAISNFKDEEKAVAMELIDEIINSQETSYIGYIFEEENKIYGYYVMGQRPLTDGVFDLYWIAVNPELQNKGIGKELLLHSEEKVKELKGRWFLAETSSKPNYEATRNFYFRNNYSIVSQIADFYSVGDNLIIFGKYFNSKG